MLDLRIWILTHPASSWNVRQLESSCLASFSGEDIAVAIRVISNECPSVNSLPPHMYLLSAMKAQFKIGNLRLARNFSILTLKWHFRQLVAFSTSFIRLVSKRHRLSVINESSRAARIVEGHTLMWIEASRETARLHLFLEDDVFLKDGQFLVELIRSLLQKGASGQFICDCSQSYSLLELGVDINLDSESCEPAQVHSFNFPLTNTMAANLVSQELVQLTAGALSRKHAGIGLGIDFDLMRVWSSGDFAVVSMVAEKPIFEQQSGFRIRKI